MTSKKTNGKAQGKASTANNDKANPYLPSITAAIDAVGKDSTAAAINKQLAAVAVIVLCKVLGVAPTSAAIVAMFCKHTAVYVNGKAQATVDGLHGNAIYLRHAAIGLADTNSRHNKWVMASIGKAAAGAMAHRDSRAIKAAIGIALQAGKVDKATMLAKLAAAGKADKLAAAIHVAVKAA